MDNIVIFGASGHAKVVADILLLEGKYRIAGLISPMEARIAGLDYLGKDEDITEVARKYNIIGGIIAIGDIGTRQKIAEEIFNRCNNFLFIKATHPSAIVARDASVADGSVIMAGAIVNPAVTIGTHCIINTNATIEHDNVIKNFVNIAPSVTTGGNVIIESGAMIGMGTNILPNITVGANAIVGAGSLVRTNIKESSTCYGIPARETKRN